MKKPIIGIVSSLEYVDKGIYKKEVYDVNSDYINMILDGGGVPIIIPFNNDIRQIVNLLNNIDGLLLIGGEDISSSCYTSSNEVISKRDQFELEIYHCFKKMKKPILGICRGLQLINVAEGGTLSNIKCSKIKHFIEPDGWINHHEISIYESTILKKILKLEQYITSSVHHQQIEKLGNDVVISSVSDDGVIESIELKGDTFVMAFQGHIEKCLDNFNKYKNVIKYFIKEAKHEKR